MLCSRYQNSLSTFKDGIESVFKLFFIFGIYFYRLVLKPFFSGGLPSCRFQPSCSEYSKQAFESHGLFKAVSLTVNRLFRCNPFGSYGYDPVPSSIKENGDTQ